MPQSDEPHDIRSPRRFGSADDAVRHVIDELPPSGRAVAQLVLDDGTELEIGQIEERRRQLT